MPPNFELPAQSEESHAKDANLPEGWGISWLAKEEDYTKQLKWNIDENDIVIKVSTAEDRKREIRSRFMDVQKLLHKMAAHHSALLHDPTFKSVVSTDGSTDTRTKQVQGKQYAHHLVSAAIAALKTDDPVKAVGAVITNGQGNLISVGWNGRPRGSEEYDYPVDKTSKLPTMIHAEQNAICLSRRSLVGASITTTMCPCGDCSLLMYGSGISRAVTLSAKFNRYWEDPAKASIVRKKTEGRPAVTSKNLWDPSIELLCGPVSEQASQ